MAVLLGSMGVADGGVYLALNLAGASLACWASWQIGFVPFVVLEGVWAVVAAVALARLRSGQPRAG